MKRFPYECIKIRDYVYHIADIKGDYCTLIIGEKLAILVDTGFGMSDLREYVESIIKTDYIVINTHGHPDHILGDYRFDSVYISEPDIAIIPYYSGDETLHITLGHELKHLNLSEEEIAYYLQPKPITCKPLAIGTVFDLGGLHVEVVDLKGHTSGSIGLLIQEDRLLVAGDALNQYLWLFFEESTSVAEYIKTLERVALMPFDTFLSSHFGQEIPKEMYQVHLANAKNLKVEGSTKELILGFETYCSTYETELGTSNIFFSKEKLTRP